MANTTIDLSSLLAPDPSIQDSLNDLDKVQGILKTNVNQVEQKQGAVLDAQQEVVDSANLVAQNDAQVANLLIDQQLQRDERVAEEFTQIDKLADPVTYATNISAYSKQLQTATKQYAQDLEESNSLNPFVGIPASFRKEQSRAAAEGAAAVLQNEVVGFQEIQKVRTAAYSNYQTRNTLLTQEAASAKKKNNELKVAHLAVQNKASITAKDLEFTLEKAKMTKEQQAAIISGMNAKLTGKQIQLSTMQMQLEAEMQPYRLENLKLQTEELRDNVSRRKSIEAQFHMANPNMTLPNNWENPAVQANMDSRMIAALQETVTGTSFGTGDGSFTAAVTSAQVGNDPRATTFVVMMEQEAERMNSIAQAQLLEKNPLAAKDFKPPFDKRDPLYNTKMDALAKSLTSHAENVDANSLISSGNATLEGFRNLVDSGEINLNQARKDGVINKVTADFLATSTFDMMVAGAGPDAQVNHIFTSIEQARKDYEAKTGNKLTNSDLARSVTLWSNFALQRNNVSPHTGTNLSAITVAGVDGFSSEKTFGGGFQMVNKPLKLTDVNQVLARFDAITKRTEATLEAAKAGPQATARDQVKAELDAAPASYNWMNLQ